MSKSVLLLLWITILLEMFLIPFVKYTELWNWVLIGI